MAFTSNVDAQYSSNSFITIVNPVRLSSYTQDPILSLKAEYEEISKRSLPATWLLTYDAISNNSILEVISSMDKKQEFGIFFEVTESFSKASNVSYNKTNSWHHAKALFLSGYRQDDRKKLIDKVFSEFKNKFGYYPKSVGGWWVDSFSLFYMKEKYGITGVLGLSDQYDLDNYQVWGTPFSAPFYPSKIHAGMPGDSSNKLDIVTFRWAARDPLNGYISPSDKQASLYSVQDYLGLGFSNDYFEKLVELYSVKKEYNEFGHITIGLEADYSPDTYEAILAKRLDVVKKFEGQGVRVTTMAEFSDWYRGEFKETSPPHFIETDDLLGKQKKVMWYQSNSYRVGLVYDYSSEKLQIIDLRPYLNNFQEPFYLSPNKQFNLSINLPYVIDSMNDKNSVWEINLGDLKLISSKSERVKIQFEKGSIVFREEEILISGDVSVPQNVKNSKLVTIKIFPLSSTPVDGEKEISVIPRKEFNVPSEGLVFSGFSFNVPFAIKYRLEQYKFPAVIILLALGLVFIRIIRKRKILLLYCSIGLLFLVAPAFMYRANMRYYVSQTEVDGLSVLSRLPKGMVLVFDKDCLRCKFETPYKPAAAGGIKSYVKRLSGQETIVDFSFSIAKISKEARKILEDKDIDYVYLVKYEDYIEHLPYLPQDLGLSKLYENANVEIWKAN